MIFLIQIFYILYFLIGNHMKEEDNSDKYKQFHHWYRKNGGVHKKIKFPTYFGQMGYVGISASQTIKQDEVFLAVPKTIIISISKIKLTLLGQVFFQYQYLKDQENDQVQFNLLVLYLIWQKQLGHDSFYYPYLCILEKAQPIIRWSDQDIQKLDDPYISVDFINYLRHQLPVLLQNFNKLAEQHPQLFKQPIKEQIFMDCYVSVMTRIFGWGLPETMMVPYADFMNHNSTGVHHYTLNRKLENQSCTYQQSKQYILKKNQLDLTILQIPQQKKLIRQPSVRQKFIKTHAKNIQNSTKSPFSLKKYFYQLLLELILQKYDVQTYPSSNSQDNDSEQDDISEQAKQKKYLRSLNKLVKQQLQPSFQQSKRFIDKQFEKDIDFKWWWSMDDKDSYFIVAADRDINQGQQIFNSYGRRSNRFLLIWYGFTHVNNKYDSITFRLWNGQVYNKTGRLLFTRYLTQKDWYQKLKLGNDRYSYHSLSDQYRLKRDSICYQLMAFLRFKVVKKKQIFKSMENKYKFHQIHNLELQKFMFQQYLSILTNINELYHIQYSRNELSSAEKTLFANILLESKRQIYKNHRDGVNMLLKMIKKLIQGQDLQTIYKQKQNQDLDATFKKKKFVIDYIKMISRYFRLRKQ